MYKHVRQHRRALGACSAHKAKENILSLDLELYSWELSYGCWKPNPGSLQELQTLLRVEPSLQFSAVTVT